MAVVGFCELRTLVKRTLPRASVKNIEGARVGDAGLHQASTRHPEILERPPAASGFTKSSTTVPASNPSGKRKAYARNGLDWTKRFSQIAGALDIPGQVIIDGEVVVVHEGRTNFSELQAELAAGRQDRLVYYAF